MLLRNRYVSLFRRFPNGASRWNDILFLLICQKEKFLEEKVSKIKISLLIYLFNIIYALYKNSLGTNNSNTVTYILRT